MGQDSCCYLRQKGSKSRSQTSPAVGRWDGITPMRGWVGFGYCRGAVAHRQADPAHRRRSLQKKAPYGTYSKPKDRIVGTLSCHTVAPDAQRPRKRGVCQGGGIGWQKSGYIALGALTPMRIAFSHCIGAY